MKKALLVTLFVMFAASWCLAQTDSLPAPTAEPCQPATCSGPCQTGACAVPCQQVPCAEPFAPKWAVGMTFTKITNAPGTFILERLYAKSTIEYRVSFDFNGGGIFEDSVVTSWNDNEGLRLGLIFNKLLAENNIIKLYWGLGPSISYTRTNSYHGHKVTTNRYTASAIYFLKASICKDVSIKNVKIRNEFNFMPVQAYTEFWYEKNWIEGEGTTEFMVGDYGLSGTTSNIVSYSIKYLF